MTAPITAAPPRAHGGDRRRPLLVLVPSADLYGSDRALLGALGDLVDHFDITMVAAVDGPMLAEARGLGVDVVVSPDWALRRKFFTPTGIVPAAVRVARSLWLLRRLHRSRRFEVVYANTVANALLPFIRLAVGAPLVVHVREVPRTDGRLNSIFFRQISRVATTLICNSTYTAGFVADARPELAGRIQVIHNGVAAIESSTGSRIRIIHDGVDTADAPIGQRGPIDGDVAPASSVAGPLEVVCVGRIHPQKGQGVLIDALAIGGRRGRDWRAHFWGDALPEHRHLFDELVERVARLGLEDRVVWHGYQRDTAALYDGMDVAVVPSTWPEGFSLVTAEAQSAGLPAIATGPGGPTDIIDDGVTGRIIGFDDPVALADALEELEDDDLRARWGAAGRRRAHELFSMRRYSDQVREALTAIANPAARSGV